MSAKAYFQSHFWQFGFVSTPVQMFPTACDNTSNKYALCRHSFCTPKRIVWYMQTFIFHTKACSIVHANIHLSHQIISYSICEHTFCKPKHIVWVHASIHFHTKAYHMVHTNVHFHTIAYHVARASIRISHQRVSSR